MMVMIQLCMTTSKQTSHREEGEENLLQGVMVQMLFKGTPDDAAWHQSKTVWVRTDSRLNLKQRHAYHGNHVLFVWLLRFESRESIFQGSESPKNNRKIETDNQLIWASRKPQELKGQQKRYLVHILNTQWQHQHK